MLKFEKTFDFLQAFLYKRRTKTDETGRNSPKPYETITKGLKPLRNQTKKSRMREKEGTKPTIPRLRVYNI